MVLFSYTDNQSILLAKEEWGSSFWGGLAYQLVCCFHNTGQIAQSPQSSPRWSPAFKIGPVLIPPSNTP